MLVVTALRLDVHWGRTHVVGDVRDHRHRVRRPSDQHHALVGDRPAATTLQRTALPVSQLTAEALATTVHSQAGKSIALTVERLSATGVNVELAV